MFREPYPDMVRTAQDKHDNLGYAGASDSISRHFELYWFLRNLMSITLQKITKARDYKGKHRSDQVAKRLQA
ncbi:MAG: hypothetical protein ACYCQJ_05275 [Nitrososphaerales archaeon]